MIENKEHPRFRRHPQHTDLGVVPSRFGLYSAYEEVTQALNMMMFSVLYEQYALCMIRTGLFGINNMGRSRNVYSNQSAYFTWKIIVFAQFKSGFASDTLPLNKCISHNYINEILQ